MSALIETTLHREDGVHSVAASAITGRVLLIYDPGLSRQHLEWILLRMLERVASGELDVSHAETTALTRQTADLDAPPLTQLLNLIRPHRTQAITTFVIAFIDRLFEAVPPAMIGLALDVVTRGSSSFLGRLGFLTLRSQLAAFGGLFAIVWTVDSCMGYLRRVSSARLAQTIQDDLRNQLYGHLQSLDVGQLERRPVNAWTSLFDSDIARIGGFIESGVDPIVTMLTNSLIVTTTFLIHSPALFAAQLLIIPGLYVVSTILLEPIRHHSEIAGDRAEELSAALRSNVSGMPTITVFQSQPREANRIAKLSIVSRDASRTRAEVTAKYVPAIQMVVGAGFLTTLTWGGILVSRGKLSMASYNVMGFTSLRLLVALGSLGLSLAEYQRTVVAIEHISAFLKRRSAIEDGSRLLPPGGARDLAFDNVTFQYEAGRPVLHGLNLRIPEGKSTGIVGATGAGKTTLLKLILRFYDIQTGSISLGGADIRELRMPDLRRLIALVAQQTFLFRGTVRDNIAYSRPDASLDEVIEAARVAQAHEFIEGLPYGYDTRIGENGTNLSGGEQQRIAIARALVSNRSILLFDEATSALDYETEAGIQKALRETTRGRTTVIVAHRLSTVRHADWIYVLDEGRVCEEGRHADLIKMRGIYANLWRIQTGEPIVLPPPAKRAPRKPRRGTD